jgi:hydrogenase maturation protease
VLTIIGCGNLTRSDDGLGPIVARRLHDHVAALGRTDVRVLDAGTDGMAVMFFARDTDALVIVDAARTGSEPGAVYEVPGEVLASEYELGLNFNDFRWDHAIAAGQRIFADSFPRAVTVLLVESESTGFGLELSPRVAAAADHVVARIERLIAAYPAEAFA